MIKSFIKSVLSLFSYALIRKNSLNRFIRSEQQSGVDNTNSMLDSISRLRTIGIDPELIIDIGAAKGKWTEKAQMIWPDSKYLLIEPLKEQLEQMPGFLKNSENVTIIEAVAGAEAGTINFTVSDDLDGSGVYGDNEAVRNIPVIKLDDKTINVKDSILMKLDTHGYEIPIFNGATQTLGKAEVVIVEVYGFYISPTAILFHEISEYLFIKGFRLYDIVDIMRRNSDQAFWQADAIYIKKSNRIFSSNKYKE